MEMQEFLHIHFIAGYGSVFNDGDEIESDICQHCLSEFIKDSFRLTPYGFYSYKVLLDE